jgi:hypothetical protein
MALSPANASAQVRKSFKMPNTPAYNGVFSMKMSQPSSAYSVTPLRHSRDGRTSLTPTQEEFQKTESPGLRRLRMLHWVRIAISIFVVGAGAAIVACEAHALHTYNVTNLSNQWFLPLWPQHFDLTPSVAILAGGAVILSMNLLYLASAIIPSVSSLTLEGKFHFD